MVLSKLNILPLKRWMEHENLLAFRIFSLTDPSEVEGGLSNTDEFEIDIAMFFDGKMLHSFISEEAFSTFFEKVPERVTGSQVYPLKEMKDWFQRLNDNMAPNLPVLIGYGSDTFDKSLLISHLKTPVLSVDLLEMMNEATATHYGTSQRYSLSELTDSNLSWWGGVPYISHFAVLVSEAWGTFRDAFKNLAIDTQTIAHLFFRVRRQGSIRINDRRTYRGIEIPVGWIGFRGPMEEEE
jgi:hypothetical protein